ncbi:MAG TPA: NADH-quinone oxidoreductase subunit N [Candidatus Binataceae bacterium]|nr:NADH-quinone oxidoreductase subunit N [Candidatus Binataceae bacterium]
MNQFTLASINFAWLPLLPLIAVALGAMAVMLVGVHVDDEDSGGLGILALLALLAAFILTALNFGQNTITFGGSLALDDYSSFFELLIIIATAITVAMSLDYVADTGLAGAEYYALVLMAALGMMLLAAAGDLIIIFIGLETMSIAVYALAGSMRRDIRSNEGGLKYFILGAFSTGFLLYGIALIYGATGTIQLEPISTALSAGIATSPLLLFGVGMLLIGFGFKVAAVPFHMWTPDAYEGAPTPVTAFMAVGVKIAAFAGFLRIFLIHLAPVSGHWAMVLAVVAALTMTVGNLCALVQTNVKRMLAYSAIAHAGYILVGMAAAPSADAGGAILYYLLGYAFTNLGAFAVVVAVERRNRVGGLIRDYRGLARTNPVLSAAMAFFMLSLTGVPPLAGFVGKFYVLSAAVNAGLIWLVILAVLNSAASAYYYVGVIIAMYAQEGGAPAERASAHPGVLISIAAGVAGTIVIGVVPQPYMNSAVNAFASAEGHPGYSATVMLPVEHRANSHKG